VIELDDPADDDLVLEGYGEKIVIDPVSLPFLEGATIDFTEELIGARFTIDNPNLSASGRRRWIRRKRDSHRIRVVVFIKSLNNLFACEREGKTVSRRSTIRRLKKFQLPLLGDGIDELEFRLLGPNPRVAGSPAPPPELD